VGQVTLEALTALYPLFSVLENGWFVFHLLAIKDRIAITKQTWLIGRGLLVLMRWHSGFDPLHERVNKRHLWVSLFGLPIQF